MHEFQINFLNYQYLKTNDNHTRGTTELTIFTEEYIAISFPYEEKNKNIQLKA
jgi:hypothetical protein